MDREDQNDIDKFDSEYDVPLTKLTKDEEDEDDKRDYEEERRRYYEMRDA